MAHSAISNPPQPQAQLPVHIPVAHFRDAQEQAQALTGWNQEYLQLSAGRYQGEVAEVSGSGIKLFVETVGQSIFQTGVLPGDVLAVGIPLHSSGSGMFCGRYCDAATFHLFSGSAGFEFRSSRQHTMLGVELHLGHLGLQSALANSSGAKNASALALPPHVHAGLKHYLLALYQSATLQPALLSNTAVVSTVADYLLDRISAPAQNLLADRHSTDVHWKLVQQSVTIVHDAPDLAPTVADLCSRLGVSRRTLQMAFARVLDVSPLAYVKAARLNHARSKLKAAASVTEAATACGFWHFGHFARDYQAMFGERPSETLRQLHRA